MVEPKTDRDIIRHYFIAVVQNIDRVPDKFIGFHYLGISSKVLQYGYRRMKRELVNTYGNEEMKPYGLVFSMADHPKPIPAPIIPVFTPRKVAVPWGVRRKRAKNMQRHPGWN